MGTPAGRGEHSTMQPQWIRLDDGTWLNLGTVVAIREDEQGRLCLEHLGDRRLPLDQHTLVTGASDIALIRTYLQRAAVAAQRAGAAVVAGTGSVVVVDDQATITLADGTARIMPRAEWEALSEQERTDLSQPDDRPFHLLGDE